MKIVVDISEKDYLAFCLQFDNGILEETVPSHRAKIAIANGTPLPKGHGRIGDFDIAEEWLEDGYMLDDVPALLEADKEGAEK